METPACPPPRKSLPPLRNWTVAGLMMVIAAFEFQRLDAQGKAHRERVDQTYRLIAIERKVDWLLFSHPPPPTPSATKPLRGLAASAAR